MSENRRFYWLKLKDDFFGQREIKKLRKIAGGDTYTVIYLKLQLLSLKHEGILYFEGVEDSFIEEMALAIDEDEENVRFTIMFLQKYGLIEEIKSNEFLLPQTAKSIGSETSVAARVRKHREAKNALPSNTVVTIGNTEKEKREKREEIEKDNLSCRQDDVKEIISYLNAKTESSYKASSKKTISFITARFNDGFTVDDFKTVIDKKTAEWIDDPKMNKFLRPETLFGTKFEGYLNQKVGKENGENRNLTGTAKGEADKRRGYQYPEESLPDFLA